MKKNTHKKKTFGRKLLKVISWILGILILLVFLVLLFIRSPWGQNIIVQRAAKFVSEKTNTKVEIGKLYISFDGNIILEELFLEDSRQDTLFYSKTLEADVPLLPIIRGNAIGIDYLNWEGVKANITRQDTVQGYNFQFLIDAFASDEVVPKEPDTTSKPFKISIGDVFFNDFDIKFKDTVIGIDADLKLGNLALRLEKTDLETMDFRASEISINNTQLNLTQTPSLLPPSDEEQSVLPYLEVKKLNLKHVFVNYESVPNHMRANLEIGSFLMELNKGNLRENEIEIGDLILHKSVLALHTDSVDKAMEQVDEQVEEMNDEISKFEWPDFKIAVSSIDFQENHIRYFVGNQKTETGVFHANAVDVHDLMLKAENIFLKEEQIGISLNEFSFVEASGLTLKKLAFDFNGSDTDLRIDALELELNDNLLRGKASLEYSSLANFIDAPENAKVLLDLEALTLQVRDAYYFSPELKSNEYIRKLARKNISGEVDASGYLNAVAIHNLNLNWGSTTNMNVRGTVNNITDTDRLSFQIPSFQTQTIRRDILQFVNEDSLGIRFPNNIRLSGNASGNLNDIHADAVLNTTQGVAKLSGHYKNVEILSFETELEVVEYKLDELLKNEQLGPISLSLKTSGSGSDINSLNAELDLIVSEFKMNNYTISDWGITGKLTDGSGTIQSAYKDENVDLDLLAAIALDSVAPQADVHLNVKGVNLQALGVMERDVRTGLKLDVNFQGAKEGFDIISTIGEGVVIYDDQTYLIGDVLATAHVRSDTTSIWIDNRILQLSIESNSEPANSTKAVQRHIESYFTRKIEEPDSLHTPVRVKILGRVAQAPVLNQVFLMNVRDLDTIKIASYFDEAERILAARVDVPHINYSGATVDSLSLTMDTNKDKFLFDLGFQNINAGPLNLPETHITGNQVDDEMHLAFKATHNDSTLTNIKSKITGTANDLHLHIFPDSLVLNKNKWEIPNDNEVVFQTNQLTFNNFKFSHYNESFEFTNTLTQINQNHIAVIFDNFNLREILNYLNPDEELAQGTLNGNLAVVDPFNTPGFLADFEITKIRMMRVDMGTLSVDAESALNNTYNFDVALKEGAIDLDVNGNYIASEDAQINAEIKLNQFRVNALEGLSMGEIDEASGEIFGQFRIRGRAAQPEYAGVLRFADAVFGVDKLNTRFTLQDEVVQIDNSGIRLPRFTILDENRNALVFSGEIGTETMINPTFDLRIDADDFQFVNATEEDNDFLYGTGAFSLSGTLTGSLDVPVIDIEASVSDRTDITYVLPSATAAIESREGIVLFINREDPEAVLTRTTAEKARVTGVDINALLKITEEAKITLIINEETGDNFKVFGNGDFNFTMKPNGRMTLTGVYDIAGGHYEMNLYNLVNRTFSLMPEGQISWSGDPMDASLNVRAMYEVEASASPLMAPVSSGSDPSVRGKYRQVLPFYVYLNIDGELEQPKVFFNLDMPEAEQGAVGGQVYGRIQQVNQQEGELNRQVFSLLVMNRFYPEPGSDGSQGGLTTIARDNLNDAISDQLNTFSNKVLGNTGFELDFGLSSYTDYQGESPEQRTQLDVAAQKKLFNDRLIVRVGSEVDIEGGNSREEPAPLIGNVSLEYYLTENGRYRLKGFRKNSYENIIDGQTIVSGLALIFTQEFNEFNELWQAILKGETDKEVRERKAEERRQKRKEAREMRRQARQERTKGEIQSAQELESKE